MIQPRFISATVLLLYSLFASQPAATQSAEHDLRDDEQRIEEIIVTGTRIVRHDRFDAAGHVVNIDEGQIDALATLNIADVLRSSPLNAFGSFNERSGNTAQSNATINLRGLGANRTLVMVDGLRLPGSPNMGADAVNINMLPMAAVQRIDILADGVSAVYGSDAIAGVVNMVLHKDFEGIELSMRYGDRSEDDGGDQSIGILTGARIGRGQVTLALEYSERDPIFDRDRWYTSPWIVDTDGDGEIHLYTDTDGISYFGRTWEIYDPSTGYYELAAAADCPTTGGFRGVMGAGAFGLPTHTLCTYAFAEIAANRAGLEKFNSYVYASYDISDNVEMYARGLFAENESFGRFAPPAADWPNPPASHPHNPFDIEQMIGDGLITDAAELWGYYRWTNLGPRDDNVNDKQWDGVVGFKGDVSDTMSFDIYVQSGEYTSTTESTGYLSYPGLEYALENDIDPFSDAGFEAMHATPTQDNFTRQTRLYAHLQFDAGDFFSAGRGTALIGAEYADTDYQNKFDEMSEQGLIGGTSGNSSSGERTFASVFAEYLLPVSENSWLNLAARYDEYSDFGSAFSPGISYNIDVTDDLALRARWGKGFKAPALDMLYGAESFSADTAYDPLTGATRQFATWYRPNPDLGAESSMSYSVGANWEYLQGHSIDLAYFAVSIEDAITWPGAQSLLWAEGAGVQFDPSGARVERQGGQVREIITYPTNSDRLEGDGIDFQAHSQFDSNWGAFSVNAFVSHQLHNKANAYFKGGFQDVAGFNGLPRTRAQASARWDLGKHGVDWVVDYIGSYSDDQDVDVQSGELTKSPNNLDSWTIMNLAYRFDAGRFGRLKIGANNLTNEDPVLDKDGKYSNSYLYDAIGRVLYVEYRKAFD